MNLKCMVLGERSKYVKNSVLYDSNCMMVWEIQNWEIGKEFIGCQGLEQNGLIGTVQGCFWAVKLFCNDTIMVHKVIIHLSKPIECTTANELWILSDGDVPMWGHHRQQMRLPGPRSWWGGRLCQADRLWV